MGWSAKLVLQRQHWRAPEDDTKKRLCFEGGGAGGRRYQCRPTGRGTRRRSVRTIHSVGSRRRSRRELCSVGSMEMEVVTDGATSRTRERRARHDPLWPSTVGRACASSLHQRAKRCRSQSHDDSVTRTTNTSAHSNCYCYCDEVISLCPPPPHTPAGRITLPSRFLAAVDYLPGTANGCTSMDLLVHAIQLPSSLTVLTADACAPKANFSVAH